MKKTSPLRLLLLLLIAQWAAPSQMGAALRYWDINGATFGPGGVAPSENWGGAFWGTATDGTSGTAGWNAGDTAVFAADTTATGTYTVTNNTTRLVNGITVEEGVVAIDGSGTIQLTGSTPFDVQVGRTLLVSNVVSGSFGLTKDGSGILSLGGAGANNYSGSTTISLGTLKVNSSGNKIPDASDVFFGNATAQLEIVNSFSETIRSLNSSQGVVQNNGTLTIDYPTGTPANYGGSVIGSGAIHKNGGGEQIFGGASTFTGVIHVNNGTIGWGGANIFPSSLDVALNTSGATLNIYGNTNAMSGLSGVNGANVVFGGGSLVVGTGNATTIYSGALDGAAGSKLFKVGTGNLTLNGNTNSPFYGEVVVNNGTLTLANAADSPTGSGGITVNSGAKLAGAGTISGVVTINNGGSIAPGSSPGTINTGAETWEGGGIYEFEVNNATGTAGTDPGWDLINVSGYLTINATTVSKFTIKVKSLTAANLPGETANFNYGTDYTWKIAQASSGINGFDPAKFDIDYGSFSNAMGSGSVEGLFVVEQSGNDINLRFVRKPYQASFEEAAKTVMAGVSVNLSITENGTSPFIYQWQKDGVDMSGQSTASLNLSNVQPGDTGAYALVISNPYGSITSTPPTMLTVLPPPCAPIAGGGQDVLGWWPANGGGEGYREDYFDVNDVTAFNEATHVVGIVGEAFSFDGTNDYVAVTNPVGMNIFGGDFTIEGWVKTAGTNSYHAIASFDNYSPGFYVRGSGELELFHGGAVISSSGAALTNNQFHHVAVVRQGGFVRLYVDGIEVAGPVAYAASITPSTFYIGSDSYANDYFPGLIDELTLYKKALAATEIAAIYAANDSGKCNPYCSSSTALDVAAWYQAESNAVDIVNGYNGTLTAMSYQTGLVGQAFSFDGSGNSSVVANLPVTAAAYTLEAWVKPTTLTLQPSNTVVQFGSVPLWFGVKSNGVVQVESGGNPIISGGSVSVGAWNHLAYTWDGNYSRLYVNGEIINENGSSSPDITGAFGIGYSSTYGEWSGLIDEVTIYTNALDPYLVQSIHSSYDFGKCGVPPIVTLQPVGATNNAGSQVTFTVAASGTPPLSYQWYKNGAGTPLADGQNVSGANSPTLTLMNITGDDIANYYAEVGNSGGYDYSGYADLMVVDPYVYAQPPDTANLIGLQTTLFVGVAGVAPLSYQWKKGAVDLTDGGSYTGVHSATLTIWSLTSTEEGAYTCVITNSYLVNSVPFSGAVTSAPANVTIIYPPNITDFVFERTNLVGTTAVFSNAVSGTQPFYYRWLKNGMPLTNGVVVSNATSSVLTLSNVTTNDAGFYTLSVSNVTGSAYETTATSELIIATAVQITNQPTLTNIVNAGGSVSLSVGARGGGLNYQWTRNGTNLTEGGAYYGTKSATLFISFVSDLQEDTDASAYKCKVSNLATPGGVNSANAKVFVNDPGIFNQPQDYVASLGQPAYFSVLASGLSPFTYQWKKGGVPLVDGANISGATTDSLTINSAGVGDFGVYSVVISNNTVNYGTVTVPKYPTPGFVVSSNVSLIEMQPPIIIQQPPATLIKSPNTYGGMTVQVDGTGPYYFQWRKNGVNLTDGNTGYGSYVSYASTYIPFSGVQTNSLLISYLAANDAGSYDVVITNTVGAVTSSIVNLIISNVPPAVTILNPQDNDSFPAIASFMVGVSAIDDVDGYVTSVDLKLDGQYFMPGITAQPYLFNLTNLAAGTYTFTAEATDNLGATGVSTPVVVNVTGDCVLPPSGIVGWWRGDNNADDFYGNHPGATYGGVSYAPGKIANGDAFFLNGTSAYVDMGNPAALQITGDLSVEGWFKTPGGANNQTLVSKWNSPTDGAFTLAWATEVGLCFRVQNGSDDVLTVFGGGFEDSRWHHVAGVWESANGVLRIYVDGIERSAVTNNLFGPLADTSSSVNIGRDSSGNTDRYFTGNVDEMAIYNSALTPGQVQSIYGAGSLGKCTASTKLAFSSMFGGPGDQTANAIAIDSGSVYVAGSISDNGDDGMIARLPLAMTNAVLTWTTNWPGLAGGDHFNALAVSSEALYVVGDSYGRTEDTNSSGGNLGAKDAKGMVVKFDFAGPGGGSVGGPGKSAPAGLSLSGSVWDKQTPKPPGAFAYGGSERLRAATAVNEGTNVYLYVTGSGQNSFGNSNRFFMTKMRSDSTNMWTVRDGPTFGDSTSGNGGAGANAFSEGRAITTLNGFVYVAGRSDYGGYPSAFYRKYDPQGTNLLHLPYFSGQFNGITVHGGAIYTVGQTEVDTPGNGTTAGTYATNSLFLVVKWDEYGSVLWSANLTLAGHDELILNAVVGMGSRIYAVGSVRNTRLDNDVVVLEINPENGALISSTVYDQSLDQVAKGVATDGAQLYVVGEAQTGGNGKEALLLRYQVAQPVQPVEIVTTTLPYGETNQVYSAFLTAVGGRPPYTWSNLSALPDGLALSPNGMITGTPTNIGFTTFTARVLDSSTPVLSAQAILTIQVVGSNALPSVSFISPAQGASYTLPLSYANVNVSFSVSAFDPDGSISKVKLYQGDDFMGMVTGASGPYNFSLNLTPGTYVFTAVAYDDLGAAKTSVPLNITVNDYGVTVIDFEALGTAAGEVPPAIVSTYLTGFGVTLSNETFATSVTVNDAALFATRALVKASSGQNFLSQVNKNGKLSYRLDFASSLVSFGFTRVKLLAGAAGAVLPEWRVTAYDSSGTELGTIGEDFTFSYSDLPEASFNLYGPDIAWVRIESNNRNFHFHSVLLDDLILRTIAGNSPPSVSISSPNNGESFAAPATVTVSASASDSDGTVAAIDFYLGDYFIESVQTTSTALTTLSDLATGTYTVRAVARDNGGAVRSAAPVVFSVTNAAGIGVINFDWTNASIRNVGGADLAGYLAQFGVTVTNVSQGTRVEAADVGNLYGGQAVAPASPNKWRNILSQFGRGGAVSFTLQFDVPQQSVKFTRPLLLAGANGITHPQWQARAFDAAGNEVASVGEGITHSFSDVPAAQFELVAPGIVSVRFDSNGKNRTAFQAVIIDDLILNTNTVAAPLEVSITSPASAANFTAPANITITADATNHVGPVWYVDFYAGSVWIGSDVDYPYSVVWSDVLAGVYDLSAVVVDTNGAYLVSEPVNITVTGTAGNSTLINFDSPDASGGDVTGTTLDGYLSNFGVSVSAGAGSQMIIRDQDNYFYGPEVRAASPENIFTQTGFDSALDFTVHFGTPLTSFGFTRPKLVSRYYSLVTHPAWSATAYDATGTLLDFTSEGFVFSYGDVASQQFTLTGQGISYVHFHSDNYNYAAFNAVLLDDFVLTESAGNLPPAVVITEPTAENFFVAPASLTITADAVDPDGSVTNVNFYSGTNLIGSATNAPYSVLWTNLPKGKYIFTAAASDNAGVISTSKPVTIRVYPRPTAFGFLTQPQDQTVAVGGNAAFSVDVSGGGSPSLQWYYATNLLTENVSAIPGATSSTLTLSGVELTNTGYYFIQGTLGGDSDISDRASLLVYAAPVITDQPQGENVSAGGVVNFSVTAESELPLSYQWFVNGSQLVDETNDTLTIINVQPYDGGNYYVVVKNDVGAVKSDLANLGVILGNGDQQSADNFADRISINPLSSAAFGNNCEASKETDEPDHAGKTGGKSVWYAWHATFNGVVSISTKGSSFDTLLAVYTGTELDNLTVVAQDDDSGGNLTGEVTFNCVEGVDYIFAVDGFHGACGNLVIGLPAGGYRVLDSAGNNEAIPEITVQPETQSVIEGATVTLSVTATGPAPLLYQWYYNQAPILNGTNNSLLLTNFTAGNVGRYTVVVANEFGSVESLPADLQLINADVSDPNQVGSRDKFMEAVSSGITSSGLRSPKVPAGSGKVPTGSAGTSRTFNSTQIFSTVGASKEEGEPDHCGEAGGASQWFSYASPTNGTIHINTDGSTFNTVIAVYTAGMGLSLIPVPDGCANNSSGNGGDFVRFNAVKDTVYYIAVDGVGGASGTVNLKINLGEPPLLTLQPGSALVTNSASKTFTVDLTGSTNINYQWKFNGANISGATASTYTRSSVQGSHEGSYTVVVSNTINVVTSSVATLAIAAAPVIDTQPPAVTNVTAGKKMVFAVTLSAGSSPLYYQWRMNGTNIPGATHRNLTNNSVQSIDTGAYTIVITNNVETGGSITSSVYTMNVAVPTPVIKLPKNKATVADVPSGIFEFSGTAPTNGSIVQIFGRTNGGTFALAAGVANWTNNIHLTPGTNHLEFKAVDSYNNESAVVDWISFYSTPTTFHLTINTPVNTVNTPGTPPAVDGAMLVVGKPYKLQAVQNFDTGYIFTNWTYSVPGEATNAFLQNENPKLTFFMKSNLTIHANFITNPFIKAAGIYNGLFSSDDDGIERRSAGLLTMKTSLKTSFSGKISVDGDDVSISGKFNLDGTVSRVISRAKQGKASLTLNLTNNFSGASDQITGTITDGFWLAQLTADRWMTNSAATNYVSTNTIVIPPFDAVEDGPIGYGYALVMVDALGKVKLAAGNLADGHALKQSTMLNKNGEWPFFSSLYAYTNVVGAIVNKEMQGLIMGWLAFLTNTPAGKTTLAPQGEVTWIKKGWTNGFYDTGFTNAIEILGSRFQQPLPGTNVLNLTNGAIVFTHTNLVDGGFTNSFTLNAKGEMVVPPPNSNLAKPSVDTKKGQLKGTFRYPGDPAPTTKIWGAVLQDYNYSRGYFIRTNGQFGAVMADEE